MQERLPARMRASRVVARVEAGPRRREVARGARFVEGRGRGRGSLLRCHRREDIALVDVLGTVDRSSNDLPSLMIGERFGEWRRDRSP